MYISQENGIPYGWLWSHCYCVSCLVDPFVGHQTEHQYSSKLVQGKLPPGSRGLPILGETLDFFSQSPSLELLGFFKRRLDKYGPVFRTNIVGEDLIVSLDPEVNNFVFQQEGRLSGCGTRTRSCGSLVLTASSPRSGRRTSTSRTWCSGYLALRISGET
ncbi:Os12g0286300 [Oryza sativa Japonica Group]|uniref:Os12g0286300 protein n=1 Tax=Oryza sativa subsp. japonica TaxID=39947 RepID=A0A0P0Y988_ORYSJ|nr:Os12g0286300 [Oryza sativa Japonica Group]